MSWLAAALLAFGEDANADMGSICDVVHCWNDGEEAGL
jgi:hypothetical protein